MTDNIQWIEWNGEGTPDLDDDTVVAYKLRNDDERTPQRVDALNWAHDGSFRDIVAFHKV